LGDFCAVQLKEHVPRWISEQASVEVLGSPPPRAQNLSKPVDLGDPVELFLSHWGISAVAGVLYRFEVGKLIPKGNFHLNNPFDPDSMGRGLTNFGNEPVNLWSDLRPLFGP